MSDLIKQCDECRLNECINCEHSWADIQEIKKQLAEKDKEIEELEYKIELLKQGLEMVMRAKSNPLLPYKWYDLVKEVSNEKNNNNTK